MITLKVNLKGHFDVLVKAILQLLYLKHV